MTNPYRASAKYIDIVKAVRGVLTMFVLIGGLFLTTGCFNIPNPPTACTSIRQPLRAENFMFYVSERDNPEKGVMSESIRQPLRAENFIFYVSGRDNPEKGVMSLDWVIIGPESRCPEDEFRGVKFYLHHGKESGVYTAKEEAGIRGRFADGGDCDNDLLCDPHDHTSYRGGGSIENLDKPDSGVTHYFKGAVESPNGNFSLPELSMMATPAPKIISALPGDKRFKLEWTPTKNAIGYVVTYKHMRDPGRVYDDSAFRIGMGPLDTVYVGVRVVDKSQNFLVMENNGLTNAVDGKQFDYYVLKVAAIMSRNGLTDPGLLQRAALRTAGVKGGVMRALVKPELKLHAISIKRPVTTGGVPQEVEEIFLKEGDILKGIPKKFASAFHPNEKGSICEGTEDGCGAGIEVSYSNDKLTKVIDGRGGVKPAEAGSLFNGAGNKIEASYTTKDGINGILLRLPVNQRAIEGTATITAKLIYGLETMTSQTVFSLSE